MKKQIDIYQIDAFTNQSFQGNFAGVVHNDDLTEDEMKLIAREMNVSETAFLSKSDEADFNLRWFTPTVEVKLCGHATIASVHYLTERGIINNHSEATFKTLSGILKCKSEDGLYTLHLPVPNLNEFKGNRDEIIETLGAEAKDFDNGKPFTLVEGGYLYAYINSLASLKSLRPNFKELYRLTEEKKEFEVLTVFSMETFDNESSAHLRFFAPYYGIDEDPVTGSANGPLLLVLRKLRLVDENTEGKFFTFEQGDIMGRKGRVKVSYSPTQNDLAISGNAVTVFKGNLSF